MSDAPTLSPDEIVFRRIPESKLREGWIKPDGTVSLNAFLPNKADTDGLSLARGATAAMAAATGIRGKLFFAVPLRVREIELNPEIIIVADSTSHAVIKGWTFDHRRSTPIIEGAVYLAGICGRAEGPFPGERDPIAKGAETL